MKDFMKQIETSKPTCIFISPHLDDAILSAGELMRTLVGKTKILVVNVFTEASNDRQTLSAWKYVKDMGYSNAKDLFIERKAEDKRALSHLGIYPINLGFSDVLWRTKNTKFSSFLGKIIPELNH